MKPIFTSLIFFLIITSGGAQQLTSEKLSFFNNSLNNLAQNPDQSQKVAEYFLKNATSTVERGGAQYLLFEYEKLYGNNVQSIEYLFEAKNSVAEEQKEYLQSLIFTALAQTCRRYGMSSMATKYLTKASEKAANILEEPEKTIAKIKLGKEQARHLILQEKWQDALQRSKETEALLATIKEEYPALYAQGLNIIAEVYFATGEQEQANTYYLNAYTYEVENQLETSAVAATSLAGLGVLQLEKSELLRAREIFLEAYEIPVKAPSVSLKILDGLSETYKKLDSIESYKIYSFESSRLSGSLLADERNVRNTLLSLIEADQKNSTVKERSLYYILGGVILGIVILILIGYYLYNKKLDKEYLRFKNILEQLENKKTIKSSATVAAETSPVSKGIVIPLDTENAILERLERFEKSTDFTKKDVSLAVLAKQLKTNTKYLSEIIHTHKSKNFNTYINELRINYIINLMKEDATYLNYKVSYLAEVSGFSSHSSFTVVFKSITGITPKQFVSFLRKNNKEAS